MRRLASLVALLVMLVASVALVKAQSDRAFWDYEPSGLPFALTCEVEGVTRTSALCELVGRQLVADEESAHPGRDVYDVEIRRDGISMCWWETASPAPTSSPSPEPGCTQLTLDLVAPPPRPPA